MDRHYYFTFPGKPDLGGVMKLSAAKALRTEAKIYGIHGNTPSASTFLGTIDKAGNTRFT
jgi:hypothetical protein